MKMIDQEIENAIEASGCLGFIGVGAEQKLAEIESAVPEIRAFLTDEAKDCLRQNYRERLLLIYVQALFEEVRRILQKIDPVGVMIGKMNPENVQEAAETFFRESGGEVVNALQKKYALLAGYHAEIDRYYVESFSGFFRAFLSCKGEIEEKLLGRKENGEGIRTEIREIRHLSTGGADIHRSGQSVIGVTTDCGVFYYKPHDCGLDMLYAEIVNRYFSDCTKAADVVAGDGFAFVSCLEHEPVSSPEEIQTYYYHFGILTALFHGLGSMDMHRENILSCGTRPACIDTETILGTAMHADDDAKLSEEMKNELSASLIRTAILPGRMYKGPLVSPLYPSPLDGNSLPVYEGEAYPVTGYEEDFILGFREGYRRVLLYCDSIMDMIDRHADTTVRCLLRNTAFYATMRVMLLRPNYLTDEAARQKAYDKLCAAYGIYGAETLQEITAYEWKCLLKGDIPYYCTTVSGRFLSGENPEEVLMEDYYEMSVRDSAGRFLSRLSEEEEAFEEALIRCSFKHVLLDEEKETPEPIAREENEKPAEAVREILRELQTDAIRALDGSLLWMNQAITLRAMPACSTSTFADVGWFLAGVLQSDDLTDLYDEAMQLGGVVVRQMEQTLSRWEKIVIAKKKIISFFPVGLYTGIGGTLRALREMNAAGITGAASLEKRFLQYICHNELWSYKENTVAEGAAGLILAIASPERTLTEEEKRILAEAAEKLISAELPKRADFSCGCAGIGAALMAAYSCLGDERFREGAGEAFQKVRDLYKENLIGWPEGSVKPSWMADRGPHAAGIYLAADFSDRLIRQPDGNRETISEIKKLALASLLSEKTLYHLDTLDDGNALAVLALLRAGETGAAEERISSMLKRYRKKNCFTVTPNGIRSSFDPSFFMGTTGTGYAMLAYLQYMRNKESEVTG